ncbi:TlpA family protein disulfide reductase [Pedobacter helvus]|uniref:TlpA family protein disulfide reductase n=1 Tax=Pedobacter helvus TaxID=2563444 RepID=A0ABW9JG52_9SPHI|nr:TlpA disulfide reductase family protein [Pedobacter ureilyticus]
MKIRLTAILFAWLCFAPKLGMAFSNESISNVFVDTINHIKPLEKGDRCPDFTFGSLANSEKENARLSDYKGKIVILDFWATWCSSCVSAMPKLNELQNKFKDKLQIIGVTDQKFVDIEYFYKQRVEKQKLHLSFPTVTEDQTLTNYFPHQSISHVVWIDGEGKVLAITDSEQATEENVRKIINGEPVNLVPKTDRRLKADVNLDEPFILERLAQPLYVNKGVTDGGIRYKSIITRRIDGIRSGYTSFHAGRIISTNSYLEALFMHAYNYDNLSTGEFLNSFPINKFRWEVGPNELYNTPGDGYSAASLGSKAVQEFNNNKDNMYCYEIVFPDFYMNLAMKNDNYLGTNLKRIALNIMKQDLMKWTGFTSDMVRRETKVLVLRLVDSTQVISPVNYEKSEIDPAFLGATFKNTRMLIFKRSLHHILQMAPPFIDETNYVGLVNFKLDCNLTDTQALAKELAKFGLELKEEVRKIPLLVVSK